jgi:putative FmdB family regulatory protein
MPIYEYVCPSCDTKFELMRPMSRSRETAACPSCKTESGRALSKFACSTVNESGVSSSIAGTGHS